MRQSARIIKQCVTWLRANPGPVMLSNFKVSPPSREAMKDDMEALIHHFKLFTEGYRSEEHTSELQSLMRISYAVFCLKQKKTHIQTDTVPIIQNNLTKHT